MRVGYATREQILGELEIAHTAYAGSLIDAKILSASNSIDDTLHCRFYPERRTVLFDWPQTRSTPTWQIDLAASGNQMISVEQCLSGDGTNITSSVILRRSDDKQEPPYDLLEIDLSTNAAFSGGVAGWQRAITVTGLYCDASDTETSISGAVLSGGINSSVMSLVLNPTSGRYTIGVGSLILMDTERMLLTNRQMNAVTSQLTTSTLDDLQSDDLIGVTSGTVFAAGETILVDSERMRINDIAGNNLIVERAFDGSTLSTHASGTQVYALRTFSAVRGVLGSTAASHSDAAAVYVHAYPPLVNELCVAETLVSLQRGLSGYNTRLSVTSSVILEVDDVRKRAYAAFARKSRKAAI